MEDSILEEVMNISKLKVPDLKRELKARGLSTSGNKQELLERLQSALKIKIDDAASAASADDLDEDLLNDDDLDHEPMDGSESVLTDIDAHLDENITPPTALKKDISQEKVISNEQSESKAKKVVLKRNSSALEEQLENHEVPEEKSDTKDKKILKLSQLSVKERLEMRAKKFGVPLTDEAKKAARSQRFSSNSSSSTNISSISQENDPVSLDILKKRADRFGGSVSTVMSTLAQQERLEKRKQRFGVVTSVNGSTSQSEKAKQRLERFKMSVS
ncbi:SAP domain-containing ribonucleoprotein isoform X2 [Agrilus planipennis]|nr:SAP domain-containing ribonucleoprotein isoform X2 [Agrilus planipennis]